MTEFEAAICRAADNNIQRYVRLLSTKLTFHERQFVKRRLAEERLKLRSLRFRGKPQAGVQASRASLENRC